ncbi:MAG TPA: four helix bundle protein [Bacteroidales bacterium]|nr:four helix bundle protein [Bacteroidales bacterium]
MEPKKNDLLDLSFEFALEIIEYSELLEEKRKFVLARQVLKSGTSIGANAREAQSAESLADFIHKIKIADKEADETEYWLLLCKHSKNYPDPDDLLCKVLRIKKLLSSIIKTSKARLKAQ